MALSGLMWRAHDRDHPNIVGEAFYDSDTGEYLVIVMRGAEKREKRFFARYNPRYGVDIYDQHEFKNIAAQLADELATKEEGP